MTEDAMNHISVDSSRIISDNSSHHNIVWSANRAVVMIHNDGTIELADDVSNDEAANAFWVAVANLNPFVLNDKIKSLEKELKYEKGENND